MDPKEIQKLLKLVPQAQRATLLAYLSGNYNPMSGGTNSALWNQYADSPDTPQTIQELMGLVEQGYNEFQIQAFIDQQEPDDNGFIGDSQMQATTLKSLAKKLQEEKSSLKNEDVFTKLGVSSPLDLYTSETVPLPESQVKVIEQLRKSGKSYALDALKADQDYQKALFNYQFGERKYQTGIEDALKQKASGWQQFLTDPADAFVTTIEGAISPEGILKHYGEHEFQADRDKGNKKLAEYEKSVTPQRIKSYKDYLYGSGGLRQRDAAKWRAQQSSEAESAVREGVLNAYKRVGRTPTMDELDAMVKYLQ